MDIRTYLKDHFLIFDGAMGTMLQKAGMPAGGLPEVITLSIPMWYSASTKAMQTPVRT